ncbi:MAG: hypothetical protein OXD42_05380, partial [Rhodospirillaceae bacterium]|nr:hypothetical protein [Rhodospirillaceae bacterium]
MRIAFLVSSLSAGGAERVAATLCNAWSDGVASATHEVHLLTYAAADATSAYPISPAVVRHPLDLFRASHSPL